ncbi:hypothetical protein [Tortoise microvirus 35]|nr:hypothetical protein [Tortoise microvirus 35]
MSKFLTQYNYLENIVDSSVSRYDYSSYSPLPSLTVPDESLTVSELLDRYAKGQPLGVPYYEPRYPDNEPDFDDFDPTEYGNYDLADYYNDSLDCIDKLKFVKREKERRLKEEEERQRRTTSRESFGPSESEARAKVDDATD